MRLLGIGGEEIEEIVNGGSDAVVAGEKTEIRVEARGGRIVIARTEVGVAPDFSVGIVADNESELGMSLKADESVEDLHSGIFQAACPANVRSFVKAGL